jgi:hypothetical protein
VTTAAPVVTVVVAGSLSPALDKFLVGYCLLLLHEVVYGLMVLHDKANGSQKFYWETLQPLLSFVSRGDWDA